jgi:serine phosphatase RsbU (regulator of sigma subunit)
MHLLEPAVLTTPFGLAPEPQPLVVQLRSRDRVLFYTDGLIEARSPVDHEFLSLEALAGPLAQGPFDGAVEDVLRRLRVSVGGQLHDDLALLLTEFRDDDDPLHPSTAA